MPVQVISRNILTCENEKIGIPMKIKMKIN